MSTFPPIPNALGSVFNDDVYSRRANGQVYKGRGAKYHTTANTVTAIANAGVAIIGIFLQDINGGDVAVMKSGQYEFAEAGAAIASLFTNLAVDNVGRFVAATTNDIIVGRNLTVAAGAGDQFVIQLYATAQSVSA